ncbi:MAG: hypothetical protein ABIZ04_13750 [Opitutus sp.]
MSKLVPLSRHRPRWSTSFFLVAVLLVFASIGAGKSGNEPFALRVWCHQGQAAENDAMIKIARDFNTAHRDRNVQVDLTFFPDFQYT